MSEIIVSGGDGVILSVDGASSQSITVTSPDVVNVTVSSSGASLDVTTIAPNVVSVSDNSSAASIDVSTEAPIQLTLVESGLRGERGADGAEGAQGPTGLPGSAGTTYTPAVEVTGLDAGLDPTATVNVSGSIATFTFGIPAGAQGLQGTQGPQGPTGLQGTQGPQGTAGTGVSILGSLDTVGDLPASGSSGDAYLIGGDLYVWNGSSWENVGNIQGPQGIQGTQGTSGPQGSAGTTFSPVVIVSSLEPGSAATGTVTSSLEEGVATYTFGIPRGETGAQGPTGLQGTQGPQGTQGTQGPQGTQGTQGPQGTPGTTYTPVIGVVTTTAVGVPASATVTVSGPTATFGFVIPKGADGLNGSNGEPGPPGPPPDIGTSTIEALEPGASPYVNTSYNSPTATFAFGIPRGYTGAQGTTYVPVIGNVSTLEPGSAATASVVVSGSTATFNFEIPRGATGDDGTGGGTGAAETLDAPITIFVPDAADEFIFGKFKHNQTIGVGDGNKTALDIIKEALFAYSTFNAPTVIYNPSSSPEGQNNFDVDLTITINNANYAAGVTGVAKVYLDDGDGFVPTGADITVAATAGDQVFTRTVGVVDIASNNHIFKVGVTWSEGDTEEKFSPDKTFTPASSDFFPIITLDHDQTDLLLSAASTNVVMSVEGTNANPNYAIGATVDLRLMKSVNGGQYTQVGSLITGITTQNVSEAFPSTAVDLSSAGNNGNTTYRCDIRQVLDGVTGLWLENSNTLQFKPDYQPITGVTLSGNPTPAAFTPPSGTVSFTGGLTNPNSIFGASVIVTFIIEEIENNGSWGSDGFVNLGSFFTNTPSISYDQLVDLNLGKGRRYKIQVNPGPSGLSNVSSDYVTYEAVIEDVTAVLNVTPSSAPTDDLIYDITALSVEITNPNTDYNQTVQVTCYLDQSIDGINWSPNTLLGFTETALANPTLTGFDLPSINHNNQPFFRIRAIINPENTVINNQDDFELYKVFDSNVSPWTGTVSLLGDPLPSGVPYNSSLNVDFTVAFIYGNGGIPDASANVILFESTNGSFYVPTEDLATTTEQFPSILFENVSVNINSVGDKRYFYAQVIDSVAPQNQAISTSNTLVYEYNPYIASEIFSPSDVAGPPSIYRNGQNTHLTTRFVFDGDSEISFRIKKNTASVDLDQVVVFRTINGSSETIVYSSDISAELSGETGSFQVSFTDDVGSVALGDTVRYHAYVWDNVTTGTSTPWPTGTSKTGNADNRFAEYDVVRIAVKAVSWPDQYGPSDTSFFDTIFSELNSSKISNFNVTCTDDFDNTNDPNELDEDFVWSGIADGDYLYWFIPAFFFTDQSGIQDITGSPALNDFITFTIGGEQAAAISDLTGNISTPIAGGTVIIATDVQLQPRGGSSLVNGFAGVGDVIEYVVLRSAQSQTVAQNNKIYRIANT